MVRARFGFILRSSLTLLAAGALLPACGGKDDPSPSGGDGDGDGMMGGASGEGRVACDVDSDCNDFFYCNGEEECVDGSCRQGDPIDCDDGVECTVDRCIEDTQECRSTAPDEDGDGHADGSCEDADGVALGDDCDDSDPLSYPGNQEVCDPDNRDEDCDPATFGTQDADQDGFIDALCCNEDEDGDLLCGEDCDDKKTNVNPAATEACDFLDNNCDGETDEGVSITMYEDKDHDGRGDDEAGTVQSCAGAVGFALVGGDCDDEDPEVFDGQFEICDGKDNNCNGQADEVQEQAPWYKDVDEDGYGDPESTPILSCYRVPGRVLSQNDCDDNNKAVNRNAPEQCDGLDNDCNGAADFKLAGVNNFEDDDGDGVADADCGGADCNDNDPRTAAGAEEVCDRIDNDCDGEVDEQTVQNIWYIDEDGDGWGVVIGSALASCDPIPNRASKFGDCNDSDRNIKPGVTEICDGVDQDCDGLIDEGAGVSCHLPNALNTCRFGQCAIFSCFPGFADANNNPGDGCEATVNPDDYMTATPCTYDTDCNDANLCNGIETCSGGFCRLGPAINCDAGPSVIQGNVTVADGRDVKDLEGIDQITGDLTINGTLLTSLVGLETLKIIGGNLFIQGNNNLIRLSGSALSGLEVVGGDIVIEGNPSLISVDLPSLTSANGLLIIDNDNLVEIGNEVKGAYPNLANIEQLLFIANNDALTKVDGFDGLGRVGGAYDQVEGECAQEGGLEIENNYALTTMNAFGSLSQIQGDLCFEDNPYLTDLSFPSLDNIGLSFRVISVGTDEDENVYNLETFDVPELRSIGSDFTITGGGEGAEPKATDLVFPQLIGVGGTIDISLSNYTANVHALEDLSFPALTDANGIYIYFENDADNLTNVDFSSLEMATFIDITFNSLNTSFPIWEFPALTDVAGWFDFRSFSEMTSLRAPQLQAADSVYIQIDSSFMQSIEFPALVQVAGNLDVFSYGYMNVLQDVDFGALQTIGGEGDFGTPTNNLDIGDLMTIGLPLNDGDLYLYVYPFDPCPDVARIEAGPFSGTISHDGDCQVQL